MDEEAGNSNLLDFHKRCIQEYNFLLESFNVLFYGYGCKKKLLSEMFPDAKIFNMLFYSPKSIADDLALEGYYSKANASIMKIDEHLYEKGQSLLLILLNFTLNESEFKNLKAMKIIGTIENINFRFEFADLVGYNFILRDLTTFENYNEETMDMEIETSNVASVLSILSNLSEKSRFVFLELVKIGNCPTSQLFDAVKKTLMLNKISTVTDLLSEFVDHNVIKFSKGIIEINVNAEDRKKILKTAEATKFSQKGSS